MIKTRLLNLGKKYKAKIANGTKPTPRGIPPLTLGYKLPKYPCLPNNLNNAPTKSVPTKHSIKTKINAKTIVMYIIVTH